MPRRRYVLSFANGPEDRVAAIRRQLKEILPGFEHREIELQKGESAGSLWIRLMREFPPFSIAHTAALLGPETNPRVFQAALALAPTRMLAYDSHGERFHLSWKAPFSSLLFLKGWPVDKIHLRPWRDDSVHFPEILRFEGCPADTSRKTIAILSPYLPWPLSHGGAVRIYNLLRVCSSRYNLHLLAFTESKDTVELGPLREICCGVSLVRKPEFRRLRWASLRPAEVVEYDTPAMHEALRDLKRDLVQTEFTQLAGYGGDVLVEHDVTMDLAAQEHARLASPASWWNLFRWQRFETTAIPKFRGVVVMSEKDRLAIGGRVIPNGVDLDRFVPEPEVPGARMLFIGSFRHFPNALAFRFLVEEFWPRLKRLLPEAKLDVVAGPSPELYYPFGAIPSAADVNLHSFVSDVRPLYNASNLVLIPTPVSAGTNIKALEAMAMERAMLSTPSGVNGLELEHQQHVWIAEGAEAFAVSAAGLLGDASLWHGLAR
ncbi:MAG: glycosyltransferase, partial [Acidobacteria bacterium]|nr:glycosyltransferase [Acidobacteriota bacterium]